MASDGTRLVQIDTPNAVGGFRFAATVDGVNRDGTPYIAPQRGFVTDAAERERLLGYLGAGTTVLKSNSYGTDGFDRERRVAVPVGYRTDGTWVWPLSVEYYLREHNVAPEPDFHRFIKDRQYRCPPVPDDAVGAAVRATRQRSEQRRRLKDEALAGQGRTSTGDPDRFPPEVDAALLRMGWYPGRDVAAQVDEWLARALPRDYDNAFERDGYPPYRPTPAAMAVLREFGGLAAAGGLTGVSMATTNFRIFPLDGKGDLTGFVFDVQLLGERIGKRVFQVGEAERGMAALAVDEDGRVYLVGPVVYHAGRTIDEALTNMLLGIDFPDNPDVDL
ncbi:MAG: hypothetical protein V7603_6848 [Micromonosporaceae bacterium]